MLENGDLASPRQHASDTYSPHDRPEAQSGLSAHTCSRDKSLLTPRIRTRRDREIAVLGVGGR